MFGDLQEGTWTFEMGEKFRLKAGEFAIMPRSEYELLMEEREQPSIKGDLLFTLASKQEWVNKVPRCLPEKTTKAEAWLWIDRYGNNMAIGEDFTAAEDLESYPVRVYRLIRAKEVKEVKDFKEGGED